MGISNYSTDMELCNTRCTG